MIFSLVLAVALSPEAARAERGPVLFGGGESAYLLLPASAPGESMAVASVRLTHPEISEDRIFDDASYRLPLAPEEVTALRAGRLARLTGTVWRFGVDRPEGRKELEGAQVEVRRVDPVPQSERGLAYRAFGSASRLYLVHPGKHFFQVLKAVAASDLQVPLGGIVVALDRPEAAATRLLPGETARVRVGPGEVVRLTGLSELWFVDAGSAGR